MVSATSSLDEQVFGILFAHGPEATFTIDRSTRLIQSANARLEDMVGRSRQALIGSPADDLFGTDPRVDNWVDQLIGRAGLHDDVSLRGLDGYSVYVAITVAHIDHERWGPLAACVARDTTERRILERELIAKHTALYAAHAELERAFDSLRITQDRLEERNRELIALGAEFAQATRRAHIGEFSAGIAHSMNNPLGALSSALRQIVLRIEEHGDAGLIARVDRFRRRSQQALSRLESIVDAVRRAHRSGKLDGEPTRLSLADELEDALALFVPRLEAIDIARAFDADTTACVPPDAFHHVVSNLIDNAIRAMPRGGQLSIGLRRRGAEIVLTIADTGCGIPATIAPRLFEPFVSGTADGTGLGLSMAQRLARQWGGDIAVVPTAAGARFDITIPTEEPPCRRSES